VQKWSTGHPVYQREIRCERKGGGGGGDKPARDVDENRGAGSSPHIIFTSTYVAVIDIVRTRVPSLSVPLSMYRSISLPLPLSLTFLFPSRRVDRNRRASCRRRHREDRPRWRGRCHRVNENIRG